jgi:hypothetical protein
MESRKDVHKECTHLYSYCTAFFPLAHLYIVAGYLAVAVIEFDGL